MFRMTKKEYVDYCKAVDSFFESEGVEGLSMIDSDREGYFTWSGCDVCRSHLGMTVNDMHGYNREKGEIQGPYQVCQDCQYMIEYGPLDDLTMLELSEADKDYWVEYIYPNGDSYSEDNLSWSDALCEIKHTLGYRYRQGLELPRAVIHKVNIEELTA